MKKILSALLALFLPLVAPVAALAISLNGETHGPLDSFQGRPPIHLRNPQNPSTGTPVGLTPTQVRAAYSLTGSGAGTIAIVDAFDYPSAESDLNVFSTQFGLPACTTANGCFQKVKMAGKVRVNNGWGLEAALDTQWAHAIAPGAKILLVEAKSNNGTDLLNAVNYAKSQPGVVAVSMSWGGNEFSGEAAYDSYFSGSGTTFFASSGDSGTGVSWPAVSANVVGVGGTNLTMNGNTFVSEVAWSGSGGGISQFVSEPGYQSAVVTTSGGMRGVPDVSYAGGPNPGFPIYDTSGYPGWVTVYGTSAGSPQWAAIKALGSVSSAKLYTSTFRDITSGTNGSCGAVCTAVAGYDYVTGLGSPITTNY